MLVAQLPRPENCETFLVPPQGGETVDIPGCLRAACHFFLPPGRTYPTVNLLRKWFHTLLMQLTRNEETLKSVMVIVDAHSAAVQNKHYILKDPADHVKLAKVIFEAVMHRPVVWPSGADTAEDTALGRWIEEVEEESLAAGNWAFLCPCCFIFFFLFFIFFAFSYKGNCLLKKTDCRWRR